MGRIELRTSTQDGLFCQVPLLFSFREPHEPSIGLHILDMCKLSLYMPTERGLGRDPSFLSLLGLQYILNVSLQLVYLRCVISMLTCDLVTPKYFAESEYGISIAPISRQ